jgi:hypothetical protein
MHSQRGQASVEWIVLLLLVALGLAALARFAARADAGHLGAELVRHVTCAARGGCDAKRGARAPGGERVRGAPGRLVTVPPLVPVTFRQGGTTRPGARGLARPRHAGLTRPGARGPVRPRPRGLTPPRRPATPAPRAPSGRPWLRPPSSAGPLIRGAGRRAGALWRRAWVLCLGYERVRYSVLHPEIRFPHQTIPVSEDVRIANDCLSPVDLVRDFGPPPTLDRPAFSG